MTDLSSLDSRQKRATLRRLAQQNRRRFFRMAEPPGHEDEVRPAVGAEPALKPSRYNILIELSGGAALLFNSVNRNLVLLEAEEHRRWRAVRRGVEALPAARLDPALRRSLSSLGFLVPDDLDELEAVRENYFQVRHDKSNLTLTIAPTMGCNFACGYCFQGLDKAPTKINADVAEAIYGFVDQKRAGLSSLSVCWYGGEPLMGRRTILDLSDRLIALCDKDGIGYNASIVTNGYFLTAKVAQELFDRRCTFAQVTLDGAEDAHDRQRPLLSGRGTFDIIMKNLRGVMEETPFAISVRVNVGQSNIDSADELLAYLDREGFAKYGRLQVYFAAIEASTPESGTAFEDSLTKAEFNRRVLDLRRRATEKGLAAVEAAPSGFMGMCVAAHDGGYVVASNGDLHKCWETAHDPSKRVGSIFDPAGTELTLNGQLWANWSPFDNEICRNCRILPMCGGFCPQRYIYQGAGDENALPCPDWKWNTAEYLFARARSLGIVTDDHWLVDQSTSMAKQSGERHSPTSLQEAQRTVIEKVQKSTGRIVTRELLESGDEGVSRHRSDR